GAGPVAPGRGGAAAQASAGAPPAKKPALAQARRVGRAVASARERPAAQASASVPSAKKPAVAQGRPLSRAVASGRDQPPSHRSRCLTGSSPGRELAYGPTKPERDVRSAGRAAAGHDCAPFALSRRQLPSDD